MSIQLKLVSISDKQNNSSDLINKYIIKRKLEENEGIDEKLIVSTNGLFKVKLRLYVINLLNIVIKQIVDDEDKLKKFNDEVKDKVKFIFNTNTLKDDNEIFDIEDDKIIYIFTNDDYCKELLNFVFLKIGKELKKKKKKLNSALEEELEEDHVLKNEDINKINEEIIKDLEDPDFSHLLSISKTKPELFDKLYQFLSNGDIVDKNEISNFNFSDSEFTYTNELEALKKLNIGSDDDIKRILMFFNGHMNLSLRYMINQKN